MSWAREPSGRRDGLPAWWPVTQRRIIRRDPTCRCPGCARCWPGPGVLEKCRRPSTDADHIGDRMDHRDINLLGKCGPCHAKKSSDEGNAAKAEKRKPSGFFDERPPGDLW